MQLKIRSTLRARRDDPASPKEPDKMPPIKSKEIQLTSLPTGKPVAANFMKTVTELPALNDGEVLVRNLFISVDPYMRGRMNEGKSWTITEPTRLRKCKHG